MAPSPEALARAVRLSLLPGMTLAAASQAAGVSLAALRRARAQSTLQLTRDDLLLAGLTRNGEQTEGLIGDLSSLAAWLDHVNHDGSTAAGLAADLARLATAGWLVMDGDRFRLLRPGP